MENTLHNDFMDCLNEVHSRDPEKLANRIRTVNENPGMARQIFYLTRDSELGLLFIIKYQKDETYGRAAYQMAQELNLGMKEEEFKFPEEKATPSLVSFCFAEDEFGNVGGSTVTAHSHVVSDKESKRWDGGFDNAVRAYEDCNFGVVF